MSEENEKKEKSSSKQKREERARLVEKERRQRTLARVIPMCIGIVIAALIVVWGAGAITKAVFSTKPLENAGAGLDDNGMIAGVKASDYVTLPSDIDNETVPLSEVEYTEESIQSDIDSELENHKVLSTDADRTVADGDEVNIDYVGTVDGEEFDGGSAEGYDLTIGSGSFVDTFEDQLIGSKPGDHVTVNVTFPDDYSSEDLQGKDAVFEVDVNGINVKPEFNDDFVKQYLSADADSAEGYRKYLKEKNEKENTENWLRDYLEKKSTAASYPDKYVKDLKGIQRYEDEQNYNYMLQMYSQYGMDNPYANFEAYMAEMIQNEKDEEESAAAESGTAAAETESAAAESGTAAAETGTASAESESARTVEVEDKEPKFSWMEYEKYLEKKAKEKAVTELAYQAVAEKAGITATADEYRQHLIDDESYDEDTAKSNVETMGNAAAAREMLKIKVIDHLREHASVK
ncbi:MAG: FKBP-type peptidyl-prolyl cis-trans isomerase [Lachnospiraceae bacterium]|nr:FKBP-type peptidyl-prolyl cis-trans isomerase [Lachnospiraceae bacterium]